MARTTDKRLPCLGDHMYFGPVVLMAGQNAAVTDCRKMLPCNLIQGECLYYLGRHRHVAHDYGEVTDGCMHDEGEAHAAIKTHWHECCPTQGATYMLLRVIAAFASCFVGALPTTHLQGIRYLSGYHWPKHTPMLHSTRETSKVQATCALVKVSFPSTPF
jgi:hypothetical protein